MSSSILANAAHKICSVLQKSHSLESIANSLRVLLVDVCDVTSWGLFLSQNYQRHKYDIQYLVDNMRVLRTHHNKSITINIPQQWFATAVPQFFTRDTHPRTANKIQVEVNNKQWLAGGVCVIPLLISSDLDVTNMYGGENGTHYMGVLIINDWSINDKEFKGYLELLHPLSTVLSHSIFSCNTIRKLQRDVLTDYLTGLFNRRFFVTVADRQVAESNRYKRPLSFLVIDINGFKQINDTHGHLVGDKVLMNLADVLHKSVRKVDYVIRFAGDEFLVLMPNTPQQHMEDILKRIKDTQAKLGHVGSVTYTVSVGKFSGIPRSLSEMFSTADHDMYKEKARNTKSRKHTPQSRHAELEMDDAVVNVDEISEASRISVK